MYKKKWIESAIRPFLMIILMTGFVSLGIAEQVVRQEHTREDAEDVIGISVSATNDQKDTFASFGLEYHHIFLFPYGATLIFEYSPNNGESREELEIIGLATVNLLKRLELGFGPGVKLEKEESNRFMGRLRLGYILKPFEGVEVSPHVRYDMIEGQKDEFGAGVAFSKRF